jgi:hypothetical protein
LFQDRFAAPENDFAVKKYLSASALALQAIDRYHDFRLLQHLDKAV